ncbi:hypothetical protein OJ252_2852 [Cryptosporidium canis]|uniref:Uncharacterized protein n=1 Tax=Cryptosporidium canis TaxID=195482 RepID=A0ABQ8P4X6_9CRYT|nr:hypothetical protein OJ252_2852 [Cryptosporidium canis]
MESTKLVSKPSFKLDLGKINSRYEAGFNDSNMCEVNDNKQMASFAYSGSDARCDSTQVIEQLKRIEEENIRLREINEQLSRSLSMSTRSCSIGSNFNSFQQVDTQKSSSFLSYQSSITSRSTSLYPNLVNSLKSYVSDIIGDRPEIALCVTLSDDVYFLGLEPIHDGQSARVVLSKTPSYWSIKKIPHFWEGFSNIVSSVMKKGFLNTLSYWSFLRAPPSPKKNVKRWEGITIKYKGPIREFRGYSLAGNDDGLFVYLQSEDDAYDNIFYCNFRRKKEKYSEDGEYMVDNRKSILNLLHANTRSYICIEPNSQRNGKNIMIKLSESKKNKLMFEEISASELLARQLLVSAEQISQEFDLANRDISKSLSFQTFGYYEQNTQRINSLKHQEENFTSRTVELCVSAEGQNRFRRGSLADELSNEPSADGNRSFGNFFGDIGNLKYSPSEYMELNKGSAPVECNKTSEEKPTESSRMCSPRIRASNIINDNVTGLEYHEVPLTRRLNVVYIPSTTAVLVHDLVDSEEELNNSTNNEQISDVEQEYFKVE